ncbi:hypothetical protein FRC02_007654, partial [Tulasnella sp. 418]
MEHRGGRLIILYQIGIQTELVLDVEGFGAYNGAHVMIKGGLLKKVDDIQPPSYSRKSHLGPVPAGIYTFRAVTARLPLDDDGNANTHLEPIGNGPWPHQIWSLESGRRGHRIKNLGIGAYMSYVDSKILLENMEEGSSSVTEWGLEPDQISGPYQI